MTGRQGGIDAHRVACAEEARLAEALLVATAEIYPDSPRPCAARIGEGAAFHCPGDPWWDFAVGLGIERPIDPAVLDEVIAFYRERNAAPKIYVTSLCGGATLERTNARGFGLTGVWHLWARRVDARTDGDSDRTDPVELVELGPGDADTLAGMCDVASRSFGEPPSVFATKYGMFARRPDYVGVAAIAGGRVVGQAWAQHGRDIVSCFGGAVLPDARGLGVQRAMLRWRIAWAKRRAAELITVQAAAGIPTERNARTLGFELAYARLRLVGRPSAA